METMLLRLSLLLATLPLLLEATSTGDGRALVEDFYRRFDSDRGADLVFVLDRSSSVTRKLWISMVNFVKVITAYYTQQHNIYLLKLHIYMNTV